MTDEVLDSLPSIEIKWPCKTCGADYEDQPCNIDESGRVTDCGKCKERIQ
jgi:hypothetical protein